MHVKGDAIGALRSRDSDVAAPRERTSRRNLLAFRSAHAGLPSAAQRGLWRGFPSSHVA